jgi:phage terminase large subunit
MWKVYGLGQRGAAKELIYTKWGISELPNKGEVFYGLDFGYNHPAALVKVEYHEGAHYVQELIYQSNLTLTELIRKMQTLDIGRGMIFADAADQKALKKYIAAGLTYTPQIKMFGRELLRLKVFRYI